MAEWSLWAWVLVMCWFLSSRLILSTNQFGHFSFVDTSNFWKTSCSGECSSTRLLDLTSFPGPSFLSSTNVSGLSRLGCHHPLMMFHQLRNPNGSCSQENKMSLEFLPVQQAFVGSTSTMGCSTATALATLDTYHHIENVFKFLSSHKNFLHFSLWHLHEMHSLHQVWPT